MKIAVSVTIAVAGALALAGCSSGGGNYAAAPAPPRQSNAAAISNTICPVMGRPVDPSVPTRTYNGRVIGFCCRGCPPMWDANPEGYAGNIR